MEVRLSFHGTGGVNVGWRIGARGNITASQIARLEDVWKRKPNATIDDLQEDPTSAGVAS